MEIKTISNEIGVNRNSVAKYLDVLSVAGKVKMKTKGRSKIYQLSPRVPISGILDFSSDLVIVLDENLKMILVNKKCEELLNVESHKLIGCSLIESSLPINNQVLVSKLDQCLDYD